MSKTIFLKPSPNFTSGNLHLINQLFIHDSQQLALHPNLHPTANVHFEAPMEFPKMFFELHPSSSPNFAGEMCQHTDFQPSQPVSSKVEILQSSVLDFNPTNAGFNLVALVYPDILLIVDRFDSLAPQTRSHSTHPSNFRIKSEFFNPARPVIANPQTAPNDKPKPTFLTSPSTSSSKHRGQKEQKMLLLLKANTKNPQPQVTAP